MTLMPLDELMLLLKRSPAPDSIIIQEFGPDDDEWYSGIRCPLCRWQPRAMDTWSCMPLESPEPPFEGCGTVWNTFSTRGRCPGCGHQWRWTSCLRCAQWSLHEDWYEPEESPD
jgi:hypothetical protein